MSRGRLSGRGIRFLADTPELKNLRDLWVGIDRITAGALLALVRSPHLHPEARLGLFLKDEPTASFRAKVHEAVGDRAVFAEPEEAWHSDPAVGWPLWRG